MDLQDALFESLQALSDDAEGMGLTDVALVLEFAMDVYLRETQALSVDKVAKSESPEHPAPLLKRRYTKTGGASTTDFLLAQVYHHAS